jgi:protein gp37
MDRLKDPLTKRPQNFSSLLPNRPDNIWIGTTVGTRKSLARIKYLTAAPAKVRFLSIEPLLEDLGELDLTGIHWVIVGGESGAGARPMHPDWARSIRDQCIAQGVPFLFKQWGEWLPFEETAQPPFYRNCATGEEFDGHGMNFFDEVLEAGKFQGARWMDAHDAVAYNQESGDWDCSYLHAGKKKAGRLLDGRTWDELPGARQ